MGVRFATGDHQRQGTIRVGHWGGVVLLEVADA
jgi:hypothetical protein